MRKTDAHLGRDALLRVRLLVAATLFTVQCCECQAKGGVVYSPKVDQIDASYNVINGFPPKDLERESRQWSVNMTSANRYKIKSTEDVLKESDLRRSVSNTQPGSVVFLDDEGKPVPREDVESLSGWGESLRRVKAVVVSQSSDSKGPAAIDALSDALKVDAYKKMLLAQPEGQWHLGKWAEEKDAIKVFVVEKHNYAPADIWEADLGEVIGAQSMNAMHSDKPLVFRDASGMKHSPFDAKKISARDVNRVIREIGEDPKFDEMLKKARDAAKNIQGDMVAKAPDVSHEPSLFPELDHLSQQSKIEDVGKVECLFPELHPRYCNCPQSEKTVGGKTVNADGRAASKVDAYKVGVRGWCECGDNHGKLYEAGVLFGHLIVAGVLNELGLVKRNGKARQIDRDAADKMVLDARYAYILCAKCGKCRKPSVNPDTVNWNQIDWKDEWVIMDCILEFQLHDAKDLSTAQTVRAKLAPQKEFLSKFPNGGVVFPKACVCKVPDPVHVGFLESDYSPYVCLLCGHERLPDEVGSIPNGPTALREMGLDEKAKQEEGRIEEWLASIIQATCD